MLEAWGTGSRLEEEVQLDCEGSFSPQVAVAHPNYQVFIIYEHTVGVEKCG